MILNDLPDGEALFVVRTSSFTIFGRIRLSDRHVASCCNESRMGM